ncbi:CAP domain-containing protein [Rothia sp. CCM 9417]|uniref:CAP domain-containing protein n=1 Tax=Rothia sp. CCM 9417 TaxID=3402657 RepID=UPI003ADB1AFB
MKSLLKTARAVRPTRRQAAILTLSGLAAGSAMTSASAAASDIRRVSHNQLAADQQTLLDLINAYRAQYGLAPVKHSATVAGVMEGEAIRQFKAGYFSHGTEFIYNAKVQGYSFVREVIALSYNDDLNQLLNFWKSSPPHRAAILSPYANVIGIGFCYGYGSSLPWRVLGNVGIYRYESGRGPNDYVSTITAAEPVGPVPEPTEDSSLVKGLIGQYYYQHGGEGAFGQPLGEQFSSVGGGLIQNFSKRQTIYWSPQYGAQHVYWPGAIGNKFARNRYEFNWGYPMNSEYSYMGSMRQDFARGGYVTSVYWTPRTGARAIAGRGAISRRWYAMGGPSVLGFPVTDETRWADGVVRVTFESGTTINWTWRSGTWVS